MAVEFSIQRLVSDGTLSTVALGIQYLQRNDIYMRIAGEETPQNGAPSGYTWSFVNNTSLKILPVVPNGVEVVVYRRTDADAMYNIYSQNAQFDEATIDENNQQLLYIAQEYLEQGIPGAGIQAVELVSEDDFNLYYRVLRTDGSYTDNFPMPRSAVGYPRVGDFTTGCTVTARNQAVLEVGGSTYVWQGVLPKIVPPLSTPSGTGGISPSGDWVDVGDVSAYSRVFADLAGPRGVELVGGAAKQEDLVETNSNVSALNTLVESRNYAKYTKASELAKLLGSGGSFAIDCYGDSTMFGATVGNLAVQNPFNPPAVLKETLNNLYGLLLTVNNLGISGTTMAQMLAGTDGSGSTFADKMASTSAMLIYCNHCINDSQLDNDIHQYRLNVIEFVRLCRLNGKVPVLVTPNTNPAVTTDTIITEQKSKRLRNYVEVMRQVTHDLDVDLVDNFYYYEQTSRMVSPVTLVPDGAHPSTEGYKMSGRNMAIPLVSAHVLRKAWDKAGLANSTYFDNISSSRQYQNGGTPFSRFDGNLSGVRQASLTGINLALILDCPTDDTVLAAYGLQWSSGTISHLHNNGQTADVLFGGDMNQYNNVSAIDWDACYIPERCKLYAGLHVVGILTSTAIDLASGEGFSLSGFGLVPRHESGAGMENSGGIRNFNPVCTNAEVSFDLALFAAGVQFTLKGCSNDSTTINLDWAGPGGALTLTTSLGGSFTVGGYVSSGVYRSILKFNSDKSISVTVGDVAITVPSGASPWPNMYVSTPGQSYNVRYKG